MVDFSLESERRTRFTPETRERLLRLAGGRCRLCNTDRGRLELHRRTNARLGQERDEDLTVLCARCHEVFHQHRGRVDQGRSEEQAASRVVGGGRRSRSPTGSGASLGGAAPLAPGASSVTDGTVSMASAEAPRRGPLRFVVR